MSRAARRKGSGYELEVRDDFRAAGIDCDRTPNSGGLRIPTDLYGPGLEALGLAVECKRQESWDIPAYLRQAHTAAAELDAEPVLVFRKAKRRANWPCGESHAAVRLDFLLPLLTRKGAP